MKLRKTSTFSHRSFRSLRNGMAPKTIRLYLHIWWGSNCPRMTRKTPQLVEIAVTTYSKSSIATLMGLFSLTGTFWSEITSQFLLKVETAGLSVQSKEAEGGRQQVWMTGGRNPRLSDTKSERTTGWRMGKSCVRLSLCSYFLLFFVSKALFALD